MARVILPALCLVLGVGAVASPASALSTRDCSVKYQAAKTAGTLNGRTWNDYRKAECAATPDAATTTVANPMAPTPTMAAAPVPAPVPAPAAAKPAPAPTPTATTVKPTATATAGPAAFPRVVDPKYSSESAGKARMHTCLDGYNAAKAAGTLGDTKWIQKGGGYYRPATKG